MRRFSLFLAMILFMVATPLVSAQVGNSEQLDPGGHRLTWTGNWFLDIQSSMAGPDYEGLLFEGNEMLFGTVVYGNTVSGAEMRDVFVDGFGSEMTSYGSIDSGSRSGVHWELGNGSGVTLYAVFIDGDLGSQSLGYFVVAPTSSFASSITTIQRDFKLNGAAVLQGVDGAGLQQRSQSGGNAVAAVPAVQNSTFVYATEVGWNGPWTYDTANSDNSYASFLQTNEASGVMKLVGYTEYYDTGAATSGQAVNNYTRTFFSSLGVFDNRQLDGGTLANGTEWQLHRFTYQGFDLSTFVTVSLMSDGSYAVTSVTGNANQMTLTLIEVQEQFSINRSKSLLDGVDPILVTLTLLM